MRLLLVNYEYPPLGGGAANATWHLARELVRQGHRVCVITANFRGLRGLAEDDGVRVYRLPAVRKSRNRSSRPEMASFCASALWAARGIAVAEGVEGCIAFFSIPSGPVTWMLRRWLGIPYLVSLRGGDVPGMEPGLRLTHRLLAPVRRRILAGAAAVVANSPTLAAASQAADPVPVEVIPNGVDAEFFGPASARPATAPFRFLFAGRMQDEKNLGLVIDAARDLEAHTRRPFFVDIVGDGPQRGDLERRAMELGLSERLCWHGWVDKELLRSLYQGADCFLNPSRYEGMPNTVLEAMACGLPVIATDIGGNRDLVVHGETGFLFPLGSRSEFVESLRTLLESSVFAQEMGARGRARVVAEFRWSEVARRYALLLQPTTARALRAV